MIQYAPISFLLPLCFIASCAHESTPVDHIRFGGSRVSPVEINHLYFVLNHASFHAINGSEFIRNKFSFVTQGKTDSNEGQSWSGTYLWGKSAYLEFFGPSGLPGAAEGHCGVGFSSQTRGDIDLLYKKLEQRNGIQAKQGLRTIQLEMGESPWFRYITVESTDGPEKPINFWLMEHHQDFLENVDIEVEKSGFLSRADYLAAELRNLYGEEASADRLFEDIVRIELELSAQERSALDALLSSFGYMKDDRTEVWIYTGPQCEIRARVTAAPAVRVQRLYCSLTTEIEDELLILATPDVSLWVGPGRVARWEFQCFE